MPKAVTADVRGEDGRGDSLNSVLPFGSCGTSCYAVVCPGTLCRTLSPVLVGVFMGRTLEPMMRVLHVPGLRIIHPAVAVSIERSFNEGWCAGVGEQAQACNSAGQSCILAVSKHSLFCLLALDAPHFVLHRAIALLQQRTMCNVSMRRGELRGG